MSSAGISITLRSNPDAEVFLLDGSFKLVARGVGELQSVQPPGLYKVRIIRAGVVQEKMFQVADKAVSETIMVSDLVTKAGAWEGSEALSGLLAKLPSKGAMVLVVFDDTGIKRSPFEGLTVYPWLDGAGKSFTADHITGQGKYGPVAVARVPINAGAAVLEIISNGKTVQQIVPLLPGQEARVFVRRKPWRGSTKSDDAAREWTDVTVQSRHSGVPYGTDVVPEDSELEVSVRSALGNGRKIVVSRNMIMRLLNLKFEDPLIGLAAAHLMFDAMDKVKEKKTDASSAPFSVDFDGGLVDTVCRNLEQILRRSSDDKLIDPDLAAVLLRAGKPKPMRIDRPPVYWRSWETLQREAARNGDIWLDPNMWLRVTFNSAWGPYFVWVPHELSLSDYVREAAGPWLDRRTSPADGGLEAIVERPSSRPADIQRSLQIPLSVSPQISLRP
jgi:hypothetical protein